MITTVVVTALLVFIPTAWYYEKELQLCPWCREPISEQDDHECRGFPLAVSDPQNA